MFFALQNSYSQSETYVNRVWDKYGNYPDSIQWSASTIDISGRLIVVGNKSDSAQGANLTVTTYDDNGELAWEKVYNGSQNGTDYGVDVISDNAGNIYVTGACMQINDSIYDIATIKYNSQGTQQWAKIYNGPDSLNDFPTKIAIDGSGNVYVIGGSEDSTDKYDYILIKYTSNGTQSWVSRYNYNGHDDLPGDIDISDGGNTITVTGGSANTDSTWDFTTLTYQSNGSLQRTTREAANNAVMDYPKDLTKDDAGNFYITGSSQYDSVYLIKIIKMDTGIAPIWTKTYGDSVSVYKSNSIDIDDSNNVYIVGITGTDADGYAILTQQFDTSGVLQWEKKYEVAGKPISEGTRTFASDTGVFVLGYGDDGLNKDIVTLQYDKRGELKWHKIFDGLGAGMDIPNAISVNPTGDKVFVSGISDDGTGNKNLSVKYELFVNDYTIYSDTDSVAQYVNDELIIRFDPAVIDSQFVDSDEYEWEYLSKIIDSSVVDSMRTLIGADGDFKFVGMKIYKNSRTSHEYDIARNGDTVKMFPFWAALLVQLPDSSEIIAAADTFSYYVPGIWYADLNSIFHPAGPAYDPYYTYLQLGLHPNSTYPDAHINIEGFWDHEVGNENISVGIIDNGIYWQHEEFGVAYNHLKYSSTFTNVKGGYVYGSKSKLGGYMKEYIGSIHGTQTASIIAGLRNNQHSTSSQQGIAGIAGGDYPYGWSNLSSNSVSLYDLNITSGSFNKTKHLLQALNDGISSKSNNGFELHIIHMSIVKNKFKDKISNELQNIINYGAHMQVIFVGPRGNEENTDPVYPSCYNDDWILNVGASGNDGELVMKDINTNLYNGKLFKKYKNGIGKNQSGSSYGGNMDLIAPGIEELVYTAIRYDYAKQTHFYGNFSGTSAAAAHVSGVAALILSYLNPSGSWPNAVAPEDVENILQLSAKDKNTPNWDAESGWGLLDATAAFNLIEKPKYRILHRSKKFTPSLPTPWQTNKEIELTSNYNNIKDGRYKADIYEISTINLHTLASSNANVIHNWPRNSASNGWGYPGGTNSDLVYPYSNIIVTNVTNTQATIKGYYYHLIKKKTLTGWKSTDEWVPFNPSEEKVIYAYSLHTYDDLATNINKIESINSLSIYPNPVSYRLNISLNLTKKQVMNVTLFDIHGKTIMQLPKQYMQIGDNAFSFIVDDIQPGFYLLKLDAQDFSLTEKIIILK
jgi:Subtilase family/Secretion system C-terminal sorting domain/Beta-propeller repeat